jgi:hypothetical protein
MPRIVHSRISALQIHTRPSGKRFYYIPLSVGLSTDDLQRNPDPTQRAELRAAIVANLLATVHEAFDEMEEHEPAS